MDEIQMQQMQAAGQVPEQPSQGQPQGEPPPQPPQGDELEKFTKDTLSELEKELAETEQSLDANYAKEFAKGMSQEELELMNSDPAKFLRLYEERKAADLKEKLEPKRQKIGAFKENLAKAEESRMRASVEQEFNAKHKGNSAAKVIDFFQNDLSQRMQKSLKDKWQQNNTSELEQLEEVYAMMKKGDKNVLPFDVSNEKYGQAEGEGEHKSAFLKQ
ncbi:MAG: hypothetical protein K2O85_05620 [Helicobacter sp.]|nr:hypothetical protein [Helicobacter sp.]